MMPEPKTHAVSSMLTGPRALGQQGIPLPQADPPHYASRLRTMANATAISAAASRM
jgi:hypothetical protein